MTVSPQLDAAALEHANDCEKHNHISHNGSDGSTVSDRINKYGKWDGFMGENMRLGSPEARDTVVAWLIDDNTPSRGHRKNILYPGSVVYPSSDLCSTNYYMRL